MSNREVQRFRSIPPLVVIPKLTRWQCEALDRLGDGVWEVSERNDNRHLRELVRLGLVVWVGVGRYRVTRLGEVARGLGARR